MNYQNIYNKLIAKAKDRVLETYTEEHHIVPKSMGGTDDASNLVSLTAKEHFLAHHLLYKIYRNKEMTKAFMLMCNVERGGTKFKVTAKSYQQLKEDFSIAQREARLGKESPAKGKKWSDESKAKLSASLKGNTYSKGKPSSFKGKKHSDEAKAKISEKRKGVATRTGIPFSEETKAMMSANRKGKTKIPWTEERKAARKEMMRLLWEKRRQEKSPD